MTTTLTPSAADADYDSKLLQAGDPLASVLHILDRFNHRHRNQHRVAKWWVQFALLRRALRRLDSAILSHHRRLRPSSLALKGPQRPAVPRRGPTGLETSRAAITAHVRWLTLDAIPPAYIAFTQLAADGQHAPLGLLLIALVARLNVLLAALEPMPKTTEPHPRPAAFLVSPSPSRAGAAILLTRDPDHLDLGVAVSRPSGSIGVMEDDHDSDDDGTRPPVPMSETMPRSTTPTAQPSPSSDGTLSKPQPKSRSKANIKAPAFKTSKRKKLKSDEFADLFSSLL
ncbi:hypothetical protein ACHAQH_003589 [Verticillium albo-atrum]